MHTVPLGIMIYYIYLVTTITTFVMLATLTIFTFWSLASFIIPHAQLEGACVPTTGFLRVRELAEGRPGKILKQSGHTLRYINEYYCI